jgi:long-chain fatty acid transport protein
MQNVLTAGAALLLTTSIAQAGGLDRSGNAYSMLFEEGNYVQLSFSSVKPDVSGDYDNSFLPLGTGSTDNMAKSYMSTGFALKYTVNNMMDLALFVNQPFGANSDYAQGFYEGLSATWKSSQVAATCKISGGTECFRIRRPPCHYIRSRDCNS